MNSKVLTFDKLPANKEELLSLFPSVFMSPFDVAAATVAVLCHYDENTEETLSMLSFLRGNDDLNLFEKIFLKDRLKGKPEIPRAYFEGSCPENGYTPVVPYSIEVYATEHSYIGDPLVKLFLHSYGTGIIGNVTLRSENGKWYLKKEDLLNAVRVTG